MKLHYDFDQSCNNLNNLVFDWLMKDEYTFSSQSSALDQDCANLKHNLSLSWWKYDKRKRRHCFMWLGFALFLVVVIVAMVVFISSLTGGSEPYTSKNKIV